MATNDTRIDKENSQLPAADLTGIDKDGYAYLKPQVDKHGYLIITPADNNTHSYTELQGIQSNVPTEHMVPK